MDAQGQKCQRFCDMVAAANVVLLMADDIGLFTLLHIRGQIDFRPDQSHDKGGCDLVSQIDIIPQRRGCQQFLPQTAIGNHTVRRHNQHTGNPYIGRNCRGSFQRIGNKLLLATGQSAVDRITDAGHRQSNGRIFRVDDVLRHILNAGG